VIGLERARGRRRGCGLGFFDMRTVVVVYFMATVLCAFVINTLRVEDKSHASEIRLWLTFYVMQAAALFLLMLRGLIPDLLSIVVANGLVFAALVFLFDGLGRFFERRQSQTFNWVMVGVFTSIHTYFTYVDPSLAHRNVNASLALVFLSVQVAWLALRRADPKTRPASTWTGLIFVGFVVVGSVRAVVDLMGPRGVDFFASGPFDVSVILIQQMLFIGLTFALFLLVTRGLLVELEQDAVQRAHADEALRRSESLLRCVMDSLPIGIAVNSVDERVDFAYVNDNFATFYRTTRAALEGPQGFWDAVYEDPEFRKEMQRRVVSDTASGDPRRMHWDDIPISRSGEQTSYVSAMNVPLPDSGLVISTVWEVTERKRAENELRARTEDLERSNRDLEQFAYVASHDLQEPLRMVACYTELLRVRYRTKLDADADEFIDFAVEGAVRMQQLLADLLDYARVGYRDTVTTPVAAQRSVDAAVANLGPQLREHNVELHLGEMPVVMGNETQLMRVFQNMIGNAIKFGPAEGASRVEVSAVRDGSMWRFAVSDNGIGIDESCFEDVFEIFRRLNPRDEYAGTGIGLAVCKRIVETLGGRIWVESSGPSGTKFCFTLRAVN